jgi:hypothetical protein
MSCWVEQEVAGARNEDQRLKARLSQVLSQLLREPERSIAGACKQWGDVLGAYRFFDNDRVGLADILSGHKAATLSRMADQPVILFAQDTTFLNFEQLQAKDEFGTIRKTVRDENLLRPVCSGAGSGGGSNVEWAAGWSDASGDAPCGVGGRGECP